MKVIKLRESDIQRIVKRVLNEQIDHDHPSSTGLGSSHGPPYNSDADYQNWLDRHKGEDYIEIGLFTWGEGTRQIRIGEDTLRLLGNIGVGLLSAIAGIFIKKGISKALRKRDIKFISKEINNLVEKELSKEDIKCLKQQLSKVGKISVLNDENKSNKVRGGIGYCLANSESGMNVDEFYGELEDIVNNYDNSKNYRKKLRKA